MSLERAIGYIDSDEFVEATPKSLLFAQAHPRCDRAKARYLKRSLGARVISYLRIVTASSLILMAAATALSAANAQRSFWGHVRFQRDSYR